MAKKDIRTLPDHTIIDHIIRKIKLLSIFQVAEQICMSKDRAWRALC